MFTLLTKPKVNNGKVSKAVLEPMSLIKRINSSPTESLGQYTPSHLSFSYFSKTAYSQRKMDTS